MEHRRQYRVKHRQDGNVDVQKLPHAGLSPRSAVKLQIEADGKGIRWDQRHCEIPIVLRSADDHAAMLIKSYNNQSSTTPVTRCVVKD